MSKEGGKMNNGEKSLQVENLECDFLCHRETPHKIDGHKFTCLVCGVEKEEFYCQGCSDAGGAERPIYHLPPICQPGV